MNPPEKPELASGHPSETTQYSVEWLVPAKNAIGNSAYWVEIPFLDTKHSRSTNDKQSAITAFRKAQEIYPNAGLRLVATTQEKEILEISGDNKPPDTVFSGFITRPPFTITTFTDRSQENTLGSHTIDNWNDVSNICYEYLKDDAYVVVEDRNKQAIDPSFWI